MPITAAARMRNLPRAQTSGARNEQDREADPRMKIRLATESDLPQLTP